MMGLSPPPCNIIFTHSEVTNVLKSLENKTSLGLDVLSNFSIKLVNFSHPPLITVMHSLILPSLENMAARSWLSNLINFGTPLMSIVLILSNPHYSKIYENLILSKTLTHLVSITFYERQFGFRKKHYPGKYANYNFKENLYISHFSWYQWNFGYA